MEKELVVRSDLNNIVKEIGFKNNKTRYGLKRWVEVKLLNDVTLEFQDTEDVFNVFDSYIKTGQTDFIKSKKLIEELKVDDEGVASSTYVCVLYELKDGLKFRFFLKNYNGNYIINNYYNFFKQQNKK